MGIVAPIAGLGGVLQAILTINIILGTKNEIFRNFSHSTVLTGISEK